MLATDNRVAGAADLGGDGAASVDRVERVARAMVEKSFGILAYGRSAELACHSTRGVLNVSGRGAGLWEISTASSR